MTQIFVSYAHADYATLEKFLEALRPVAARLELTLWWDEELQAGQKWDARIRAALEASDVFICFATNAFLKPDGYIVKTELPAIRAAEKSRGALMLPVIAEPSHWADEFGDTQAVPKTRKKTLRPIAKWSPRSEGFHEASLQLKKPIIDFLNAAPKRPDPGPGPAMAPTPAGFTILGKPPSEEEQRDPSLKGHHDDILDALAEIEPLLDRLGNVDPKLVKAVRTYAEAARKPFAEVPLDRLWSLGSRLCERVETLSSDDLGEIFDARTLRDVTGELNRLHRSHSVLMMSTGEGRELTGKITAYRSASTPLAKLEGSALGVLAPMTRQRGLLDPAAKKFVESVAEPLGEGTERIDEIEVGLRTALHAVTAFVGALEPLLFKGQTRRPDEATLRDRFAGDPNLDTLLAAFAYIGQHDRAIAAFAEINPDLRRYVDHTLATLSGRERKIVADPDVPPPGFDMDLVHEMILRGEAPPKAWAKFVKLLDFSGRKDLKDLSPIINLAELQSIDISGTSISDLSPIKNLVEIISLKINETPIWDITPAENLVNLLYFYAWDTIISDISPLANATKLQSLYAWGTKISDLSPLAGCRNIKNIYLSDTLISDLSPLSALYQIKDLHIWKTQVKDISSVPKKNLETLDISFTDVNDISSLENAILLRELSISFTRIKNLTVIEKLESILSLDASHLNPEAIWPNNFPKPLAQLNLAGSTWSSGRPLPRIRWQIDPDGTISRDGDEIEDPIPFREWVTIRKEAPLPILPPEG